MKFFSNYWDSDGFLEKQILGNGYISSSRMMPGLSGAPLIQDLPYSHDLKKNVYSFRLSGLVQGHHRFEDKSFFVGEKDIQTLTQIFLSGKRGRMSQTQWRLHSGVTYRDFGNGVFEVVFAKVPSSSFLKGDSGNAISADGYVSRHLEIGIPNTSGTTTIGMFVKSKEGIFPILAEPQLKSNLPIGMIEVKSFGPDQDLWELAKAKNKFKNKLSDITSMNCTYKVTEEGIDVKVQAEGLIDLNWKRSRAELSQGFKENQFIVRDTN